MWGCTPTLQESSFPPTHGAPAPLLVGSSLEDLEETNAEIAKAEEPESEEPKEPKEPKPETKEVEDIPSAQPEPSPPAAATPPEATWLLEKTEMGRKSLRPTSIR